MPELTGKVALVTGASRGIGEAIALALAREGAAVAICGRKQDALDQVASKHPGLLPVACHVGRAEELARLVETVEHRLGPIDVLVNNAATNIQQGFCLEAGDAQFDKMIEINLKSAFRLIRLVAPGMCARGRGSIINIASVAGLRPQFESVLYSMTKAALIMLTRSCALELGTKGVRVNAIAPGLVETRFSEYFWKDPARRAQRFGRQAIQRIGRPEEIAEIALLLAGERAAYITGEVIVADGGLLVS
jgi:NAD(P)-dependent dehydrogenase (short-subunit alcohol dehydrogenase family)